MFLSQSHNRKRRNAMQDLQLMLCGPAIESFLQGKKEEIHPITLDHLERLFKLYQKVENVPHETAVNNLTAWLHLCFPEIPEGQVYQCFADAINGGKDFHKALVREFVLPNEHYPFTSEGYIRPTNDPVKLLRLCFLRPDNPHYNLTRVFEAHLFWHLGMRYLLMKVKNKGIYERLPEITLWLEDHLFSSGPTIDTWQALKIHYDPDNYCRWSANPEHPYFWHETWFRHITLLGRIIKVLFEGREKKAEDIFRKVLLKSQGGAPLVADTCAITLVFFNEQDLKDVYEFLKENVFVSSDLISHLRMNGFGHHNNGHSSDKARPYYHFIVHFFGGPLEVQLFLIENWVNRKFSMGPENHRLYRLNQVLPLMEVLMPFGIFPFDWQNPVRVAKMIGLQKKVISSTFCEQTCSKPA